MSVGRCKQPEGELCEHEGCLVARGMLAVGQQRERVRDRGSAVGFVAERMRES